MARLLLFLPTPHPEQYLKEIRAKKSSPFSKSALTTGDDYHVSFATN